MTKAKVKSLVMLGVKVVAIIAIANKIPMTRNIMNGQFNPLGKR